MSGSGREQIRRVDDRSASRTFVRGDLHAGSEATNPGFVVGPDGVEKSRNLCMTFSINGSLPAKRVFSAVSASHQRMKL